MISVSLVTLLSMSNGSSRTALLPDARLESVTGTYEWKARTKAGCILKVEQVTTDSVRVQFDCTRGAPSYNSGVADGVIRIQNQRATLSITGFAKPCALQLRFSNARVAVVQHGSDADCGFGFGVTAQGDYRRTSKRPPIFDKPR